MIRNEKNGIIYYTFENLAASGVVRHGFSTRIGGVSKGHFASMNLGLNTGDDLSAVKENYHLFCDVLDFDMRNIVIGDQYHTTNIYRVKSGFNSLDFFEKRRLDHIDGFVTDKPGVVLATYYADCVPMLFCDPVKRVIANSHAGWRGTAHNMAGKTVERMRLDYGCDPRDILVGIGPSISCKNFEVGSEVAEEFEILLPFSAKFIYNSESKVGKYHIDLWEINRQNLITSGVLPQNIEIAGLCTYDGEEEFYSHRRNGKARGSLAAFIELENL